MTRRIFRRFAACLAIVVAPLAAAAPGSQLITFNVAPGNAPKLVAAFDQYYASSAGQKFKGRATLSAHVADGADPATHSLLLQFHSQAEQETYTKAVTDDPARKQLLDTIAGLGTMVYTGRSRAIRSWGEVSDSDTVWTTIVLTVSDPAGFNAALDAWLASPGGKKFPGQGHLSAITAGGAGTATHVVSLGYASMAEMEAYQDSLVGNPEYAAMQAAMGKASMRVGTYLGQDVKSWGPATRKSFTE